MKLTSVILAAALFSSAKANAATVFGGTLLTQTDADQIETWLGESGVAFTSLYGSDDFTPQEFHDAANNLGRTIVLMSVTDFEDNQYLLGGYNPQSWTSAGTYNFVFQDSERTAFIFNLTSGLLQRQNLDGQGSGPLASQIQTFNHPDYGPQFGFAADLMALTGPPSPSVYLSNFNYGGTSGGLDLVGAQGGTQLPLLRLEVFSVTSETPEPSTFALCGLAFTGLIALRRKRAQ